eukprot:COSAG02_NODE_1986_length_10180_cov_38.805575_7_plen_151_part_00
MNSVGVLFVRVSPWPNHSIFMSNYVLTAPCSVVKSCFPRSWFSADISASALLASERNAGSFLALVFFFGSQPPTLIFWAPKLPLLPRYPPRTYDIARNQGSITTRNGNNSRTKRLLGKSHIEVFRHLQDILLMPVREADSGGDRVKKIPS